MKEKESIKLLLEQKRLLQIEYEEEKALFTKISENEGLEKLKARGNALTNIKFVRSFYNSLNQRIVEILYSYEEGEEHNFEYSRPVMFFTEGSGFSKSLKILFPGEVNFVDGDRMLISIGDNSDLTLLASEFNPGIMLSFDETTYRAMFDAIDYAISGKGRLGELRDLIYSGKQFGNLSLPFMSFPYLNKDQEIAVNKVLCAKDVAIIHGPPGTGKTTTLVEAIYETLRREPQVLVCAQSNMAVDWISEKLVDRGVNVLRLGNPSRVNDKMLSFTYERRFESHPSYPDLWSVRKVIRQLHKDKKHTDSWHQKMDRLKSRATELEIRINNDIFSSANVVASTLVGSSSHLLAGMKFSSLFIDEAAQALEAATWIPIRRAGRVILAGDHCQLPPTVKSYHAMKEGLGVSLMERIAKNHPECVKLLTMQYRMHQEIMNFSNNWFYDGMMTASPDVKYRSILDFDKPLEWIDTGALSENKDYETLCDNTTYPFSESVAGNFGKINKDEGLVVLIALQKYIEQISINRILEEKLDIGIISPYRAQTEFLKKLIKHTPFFKPIKKLISVNTVDGFQGQERDIIIVSMVRSNDEGNIGFLNDLRRMNVAMTRARMKLIMIGNTKTLSHHRFYRELIHSISKSDNGYLSADEGLIWILYKIN